MIDIINLKFKNKNKFKWNDLEKFLMYYKDKNFCIDKFNKNIKITKTSIDEMSHSKYNMSITGKLRLIKANLLAEIDKVIKDADNERWTQDYNNKHKNLAKNGWLRYDIEFTYPKKDVIGNIIGKEEFLATMIVSINDLNENILYDVINIKKA